MNKPPPDDDQHNRIVAVTLDEESIGRSGPDIEHERAIAIYDLIEQNVFAPEGAGNVLDNSAIVFMPVYALLALGRRKCVTPACDTPDLKP